ncbi:hypothetical protein FA13DRAFT_1731406 [Coprinellus micaceus]|uniref:F-box domain-containing protein n=1 Tax=Coprinellus micaceus TaxID=71717 RepID=A0A4Y7TFY7_COPMI|nr:hypothetical protein FA13DRAFT_1731406 [Coprinellus micaceus]
MAQPSLPPELLAEILSYLRTNPPTSLDGLQIAFTCRAVYEEFKPLISAFHVRDHNSQGSGHLVGPDVFKSRAEEAFARTSANSSPQKTPPAYSNFEFPDFEVAYLVEPYSLNDVSTVWSLASLLSRPHIALHLRRFILRWGIKRPIDPTPTAAWQRALAHLVQTCTGIEGVELILMGTLSPGVALIGPPPHFEPPTFSNSQVSKLCIEGIGFTTFWRPHLHSLLTQSANTLTHLSIDSSPHPPDSWEAVFSNEWGLHRLEHFEIKGTEVPFTTLVRFLFSCPSISSAILSIPHPSQSGNGGNHTALIQPEDRPRFLPNLRRLDATLNILLTLFDHSSFPNYEEAQLIIPRLGALTVLGEDITSNTYGDESQSYNNLTKLLSCLTGRPLLQTLEMQIRYTSGLETWLESASAGEESPPQGVQVIADGTWSLKGVAGSLINSITASLVHSHRHTPSLRRTLASLPHIRSLTLEFSSRPDSFAGYPPNYAIRPDSIATFMSALPGLEEVVLDGAFYRPENAVKNTEALWEELGKMWTVCPQLERLEVRKIGGSNTPAVWKRGEEEPTPGFDFNDWAAAFLMVI